MAAVKTSENMRRPSCYLCLCCSNNTGVAFDFCAAKHTSLCDVDVHEQVGASQLAPVAGREMGAGKHVFPVLRHRLCYPI